MGVVLYLVCTFYVYNEIQASDNVWYYVFLPFLTPGGLLGNNRIEK